MSSNGTTRLKDWLPRYWWDVGSLARSLRDGTLTEREKFPYVFVWFWASALAWLLTEWEAEPLAWNALLVAVDLSGQIVLVVGVFHSFKINQTGDNRNYLERLVCLLFPIMVRSIVCIAIVTLPLIITAELLGWGMDRVNVLLSTLSPVLLYPAIVWQLCWWMRWVAQGTPSPANDDASQSR